MDVQSFGNVVIFGDSYSTFCGYIPDGYETYYENHPHGSGDVTAVEQTWWHQLIAQTDSRLLLNSSWSGTTICHTGYSGDCSNRSFIARLDQLIADGYFSEHTVDTVFVFGGTNDSWADSPIGTWMTDGWRREDLFSVIPAIHYMFSRLKSVLPHARIVCIINTELKSEIAEALIAASHHYGVEAVALHDIDKLDCHPSILGMTQIRDQILAKCRNTAR